MTIPILLVRKLRLKRVKNLPKGTQRIQRQSQNINAIYRQSLCLTTTYSSGSQLLMVHSSATGHFAVSEDIFGCHYP